MSVILNFYNDFLALTLRTFINLNHRFGSSFRVLFTCLSIMSMALCILKLFFSLFLVTFTFLTKSLECFGLKWNFLIKITGKQTHECSGKCFLSILISLLRVSCVCFVEAKYSLLIYDTKTRKKIQKHSWLYRRYTSNIGINKKNLVRQQS